ncbi:MAG: hypothetical protein OES34_12210 [Nitrosopumilus sp.]|nr:hypothetical protein [Nitrosopumilus sp.]
MSEILSWFETNSKRSIHLKLKQFVICDRTTHDYIDYYGTKKDGTPSQYMTKSICNRCNHLQLYHQSVILKGIEDGDIDFGTPKGGV